MSDSQSSSVPSWSDVHQKLRAKAEAARGTVTITSNGKTVSTYPHTTSSDALAIAPVFDSAVNEYASETIVERWNWEADLLSGEPEYSAEPYIGNRSFWLSVADAATELDRVHAPMPSPSLVDAALHELAIERPEPADELRNAAASVLVTVFSEPSWEAMARRQLEFFRSIRGEDAGDNPFVLTVPTTCNADILALAHYWTQQIERIGARACDTYHRLVFSCWREVLYRVARDAKPAPVNDTYAHNNEFWSALLMLATQSDARLAPPTPWAFHVPQTCQPRRNAEAVDSGPTLDFPAAKTWDEAARMQREAFVKLRGEDKVTGRLIASVPRTTIADVRQLAAYWSAGLAKVGGRSFADISYRHVIDRWLAAVREVDRIPLTADPGSVYERNVDFWEALMTIAIQVAVTAEAPTRWQLAKEAAVNAAKELPNTLKTAVNDFISRVVARPLLYAGIGVGGLVVVLLLLRRPGKSESKPESTS